MIPGTERSLAPTPTRLLLLGSLLGALFAATPALAAEPLFGDGEVRGYDAYTGPYAAFGIAIGRVDYDDGEFIADVDSEASGGFTLTGGYRFLPWLSGEAHFIFLGGNDNVEVGNQDFDSEGFAFTFGPKVYPLALLDESPIPENFQPYAAIGIGGGELEIDAANADEEDSFVARFILGVDIWATDHVGFFVEGGGYAVEEDAIDGIGVFTFGGQYRF
ncbi:MAG: outer membrane beta-barrel protein [Myxococcota bacterium]